jgi:hypothetical protein
MAAVTFAKILGDGSIKVCSGRAHFGWKEFGPGKRLSKLRYDAVGKYSISAGFNGKSDAVDGPYLWWELVIIKHKGDAPVRQRSSPDGFLDALEANLRKRCSTIRDVFESECEAIYSKGFATAKEAVVAYQDARKNVRAHVINSRMRPEPSQELLAQLGLWCEQVWGRQTEIAKVLGTTPQRVNDWINGRKRMNADQALFLREFLNPKQRRKKEDRDRDTNLA